MLPVINNLSIYQGDTFTLLVRLYEKDFNGDKGPLVDLTGATPQAQIRREHGAPVLASFDCTLTSNQGEVMLELDSVDTLSLEDRGAWDFQITFPDGRIRTYLRGSVSLVKEITSA